MNNLNQSIDSDLEYSGFFLLDSKGVFLDCDQVFLQEMCFTLDKISGKNFLDILCTESQKIWMSEILESSHNQNTLNLKMVSGSGQEILRQIQIRKFATSGVNFISALSFFLKEPDEKQGNLNYESILNYSFEGFMVIDSEMRIILFNQKIENDLILYYEKPLCIGQPAVDIIFPEHKANFTINFQKAMSGEKIITEGSYIVNDETRWSEFTYSPIQNDAQKIEAVFWAYREITEEKILKLKLLTSKKKYRLLFETMSDGVVLQDTNGKIIDFNPRALEILGLTEEEIRGRTSLDPRWMALKEDGSPFLGEDHPITVTIRTKQKVQDVLMQVYNPKKKIYVWIKIDSFPIFDTEKGGLEFVYALFRDYSSEKMNEEILKESNRILEKATRELEQRQIAIDNHAIIAFTDRLGRIEFANQKFCDLSKYSYLELKGKTHKVVNSGYHSKEFFKNMHETIKSGKIWKGEIRNRAKDGGIYWVNTTIAPILDEKGTINKYLAIRTDITDRKIAEEKLVQYSNQLVLSNQTKDKLMSVIAHDLKNAFFGILGINELLQNQEEENFENGEFISNSYKLMNDSIQRTDRLLDNLLNWSRAQSHQIHFQPKENNINEIIENAIHVLSSNAYLKEISIEYNSNVTELLQLDKDLIESVVRNLLSNAIKYSPRKSRIRIQVTKEERYIVVQIEDQGIGIDEFDLENLFVVNVNESRPGTEREKGTGLGLSICKEFIELHKGELFANSKPGKGTRFTFTLPII